VFTLAADDDEIALPFLASSPALDSWRMLAILQVGDEARQVAIASRRDIHPEAVAAIAGRGPRAAVSALLDNPACRIGASDYRRIYERFATKPRSSTACSRRPTFRPNCAFSTPARQPGAFRRCWPSAAGWRRKTPSSLLAEAEEAAILRILETSETRHLDRLIAFLSARDMLHASLILRAACRGRMAVVERALAWLSSLPKKRVHAWWPDRAAWRSRRFSALPGCRRTSSRCSGRPSRPGARPAGSRPDVRRRTSGAMWSEALMTCFPDMPGPERARLLELVSRFTEGRARALAHRLRDQLVEAA
jgi:uncharacterized protein (DUF2336 family)